MIITRRLATLSLALGGLSACVSADIVVPDYAAEPAPRMGVIEILVPMDNPPIAANAVIEDLGGDFTWSEGPVWIADGGYLLFTDVPERTIHHYADGQGITEWMMPSTRPGATVTGQGGANGLLNYTPGKILVPDHGSRSLYSLDLATRQAAVVADRFQGGSLNSPNDVVVHSNGTIFFTDPPYGLPGKNDDPLKQQATNNVFRLGTDGRMSVVEEGLDRPNGIALSPDERTLYVASALPEDAKYMAYTLDSLANAGGGRLFADVRADRAANDYGNPDGMVVSQDGTIFATGPGGLLVFSPEGEMLSRIRMDRPCANVTFGDADRRTLYLTCQDRLVRLRANRTGLEFQP